MKILLNKIINLIGIITFLLFSFTFGKVNAQSVNINATVPSCIFNFTVKPEKRIPRINNWGTILSIQIYKNGQQVFNTSVNTDIFGKGSINVCLKNFYPTPGNYDFYLRGYSHLLKKYYNISAFSSYTTYVDFSSNNAYLTAGETSVIFDNFINALDLSTQIRNMYTTDYKNDLNQDGQVNALDLSITIGNFYKVGD